MVACSFSGVTVPSYRIESLNQKGAYYFDVTLKCRGTLAQIASLQALQGLISIEQMDSGKTKIQTLGGTKATLVLNGTSYLNCYISELNCNEAPNSLPFDQWESTIKFIQETV